MKTKCKKKAQSFHYFFLIGCILLGTLINTMSDFWIGFLAGINDIDSTEASYKLFENSGQIIGWITLGLALIILCIFCYKRLRTKVTGPIEQLAIKMNEVKAGDLTVRTQIDGDYEIVDIQSEFNSMVEELENQSYQLKMENADIIECLRECVANYYPILEESGIELDLDLPDTKVMYTFDNIEMKRVFTNLLTNMVKHNPSKTSCRIVAETLVDKEGHSSLEIVIADNGPKIPLDLQPNLFDTLQLVINHATPKTAVVSD